MDKIQIKESDYKVYYDYCLRYYQVHNTIRQQSIHILLDLFEKGIIPVEERDISQARQFLSAKCDDLRITHEGRTVGEGTTPLQLQVCSDLLLLCEDLPKMFHLIEKRGLTANYLTILGTFSRVIDENRNLHLAGLYNLKSELIDALAAPLANIIRSRIGPDQHWGFVLRELTVVAARFNQQFSEPRFDLATILIVGPAVVSHFDKNVENREILSVLPTYFEESELEEFEAFLNNAPGESKNKDGAGIPWDEVVGPLKAVADAIAAQRDHWAAEGRSDMAGGHTLPPSMDAQSPGDGIYPVGTPALFFPGQPPAGGQKTFDIVVSPDTAGMDDLSFNVWQSEKKKTMKVRLRPFVPALIGISVILIFVIGTLIVSGAWNPAGAGHAANTTVKANSTATAKPTPAKTNATPTPAKTNATPTATPTPRVYSPEEISNHLQDIAFGPSTGVIKKLNGNLLPISVSGSYTDEDVALLNNFIAQFDINSATTQLLPNVTFSGGASGIRIVFLPESQINQLPSVNLTTAYRDAQSGNYYFVQNGQYEVVSKTSVKTYVDSDLTGDMRKRWILRAVLFNLGFTGESGRYPDSIFYGGSNGPSSLDAIDWDAIHLMYGSKITNGMTMTAVQDIT
jgi:hypothetical protein